MSLAISWEDAARENKSEDLLRSYSVLLAGLRVVAILFAQIRRLSSCRVSIGTGRSVIVSGPAGNITLFIEEYTDR